MKRGATSPVQFHSSPNNLPNVGLCFSLVLFLRSGTTRAAGGAPIRSRAIAFTAATALKRFFFRFLAISLHLAIALRSLKLQ